MALPVKQKMVYEKETVMTYRYQALPTPSSSTVLSNLYIPKSVFNGDKAPDYITVTVEEGLHD